LIRRERFGAGALRMARRRFSHCGESYGYLEVQVRGLQADVARIGTSSLRFATAEPSKNPRKFPG
jgi:hypothetical protein